VVAVKVGQEEFIEGACVWVYLVYSLHGSSSAVEKQS